MGALVNELRQANNNHIVPIIDEITRTKRDLRARVSPKYRFDERYNDLKRYLQLDGYLVNEEGLKQMDPSIGDSPPWDDDLIQALEESGLPEADEAIRKINDSSDSFRAPKPNYNACLNDIRVALETVARSIAHTRKASSPGIYVPTKWGSVIQFLRNIDLITQEEERGLCGVYGFVSPGSHRSLGISEEEMSRLGRSLALAMCWFLIKVHCSKD